MKSAVLKWLNDTADLVRFMLVQIIPIAQTRSRRPLIPALIVLSVRLRFWQGTEKEELFFIAVRSIPNVIFQAGICLLLKNVPIARRCFTTEKVKKALYVKTSLAVISESRK